MVSDGNERFSRDTRMRFLSVKEIVMPRSFTKDFFKEFHAFNREKRSVKLSIWIVSTIAASPVETLIRGENLLKVYNNWLLGAIVLVAVPVLMLSIAAVHAVYKVVSGLYHSANNTEKGSTVERKIELPEFAGELLAFVPQVIAKWEPSMVAQKEEFISELKYVGDHDVLCRKCKSQLVVTKRESGVMSVMSYYSCGCGHIRNLFEVDLHDARKAMIAGYKQYVRTNFEEVWEAYVIAYNKYVGGRK